jgi:hypothetical protein
MQILKLTTGKHCLTGAFVTEENSRWKQYPCEEAQPQTFWTDNEECTLTVFTSYIEDPATGDYTHCQILLVLIDCGCRVLQVIGEAKMHDPVNLDDDANNEIINELMENMLQDLSKQAGYTV